MYVLINGKLRPDATPTARALVSIATNSLESLMSSEFHGDLYRMLLLTSDTGMKYQLMAVPADLDNVPSPAEFDRARMSRLFEVGAQLAAKDSSWQDLPSGLDDSEVHLLAPNRLSAAPARPAGPKRPDTATTTRLAPDDPAMADWQPAYGRPLAPVNAQPLRDDVQRAAIGPD